MFTDNKIDEMQKTKVKMKQKKCNYD